MRTHSAKPSAVALRCFVTAALLAAVVATVAKPATDAAVRRYPAARRMLGYQPKSQRGMRGVVSDGRYNFARVYSYLFLLVLVSEFTKNSRRIGVGGLLREGFARDHWPWRDLGKGILAGVVSVAALVLLLWAAQARELRSWSESAERSRDGVRYLSILISAFGAGVPEEIIFRGILLGSLMRDRSVLVAVLIADVVFVLPHFFSGSVMVTYGFDPWVGLRTPFDSAADVLSRPGVASHALGLAAIGAVLCLAFVRTHRLYLCIGLHTGWVLAQKLSYVLTSATVHQDWQWLYGGRQIVNGLVMWVMVPPLVIWLWRTTGKVRYQVVQVEPPGAQRETTGESRTKDLADLSRHKAVPDQDADGDRHESGPPQG